MAGESSGAIEVVDLTRLGRVWGGSDKQTDAADRAIAEATSAVQDVAARLAPKPTGMTDLLLQMMNSRRPGPGPTPAPALPPASTLTR